MKKLFSVALSVLCALLFLANAYAQQLPSGGAQLPNNGPQVPNGACNQMGGPGCPQIPPGGTPFVPPVIVACGNGALDFTDGCGTTQYMVIMR